MTKKVDLTENSKQKPTVVRGSERGNVSWPRISQALRFYGGWLIVALVAAGFGGCRATNPNLPKTDSTAALIIYGADNLDIREAARNVFQEHQFQQTITNATLMTFEKRGSVVNDITYGSFLNNQSWIRAKLTIQPWEEDQHLLECRVFMVRNHGESFFEEETKVNRFKRGHYQDILDEISLRVLDSSVPKEPSP